MNKIEVKIKIYKERRSKMDESMETRIRQEQTVKNNAWLRADAVYKIELHRMREELHRKNILIDQLTKGVLSLLCVDSKPSVHIRFND